MRYRVTTALLAATIIGAALLSRAPKAAATPAQSEYVEVRPEPAPGRRGLVSVSRWTLLTAGAGVALLALLCLAKLSRQDGEP